MRLLMDFNGITCQPVTRFCDREKGKPAWVLGGGPSLLKQDPKEVDGGCVIAVNFSIWAPERLGFPSVRYWIFGDTAMLWRPGCEVANPDLYPDTHKFVSNAPCWMLLGRGYEPSLEGLGRTFFPFANSEGNMVSRFAPWLWTNRSTLNAAISLAWTLGCNPIHIRGADFGTQSGDGRAHWYDPAGLTRHEPPADYSKQKAPIKFLISCIKASGVTVTAEADKSILEA